MNLGIRGAGMFAAVVVVLGGCATAAPAAVAAPQPQSVAPQDLPAWVLALPEGEPPRDNDFTGQAALFLFQAASADNPGDAAIAYQQALGAAQSGITEDPTNAQSYLQAGEAYLGQGDIASAGDMFDQAEAIYPRFALDISTIREQEWIALFNQGVEALQTDDQTGAIASFESAHEIYQGRPEAMIQLGALYAGANRPQDAADMFGEAIEMMEGPLVERLVDPDLLASIPENLEISRFQRAQILYDLGDFAESASVYREIVEANPDDLMAVSNLGAILVEAGDLDQAASVYDDLLSRPGLGVHEYNGIAIGAYNGDLFVQAADAFGRAHELLPQNRDFIFNQAQSLYLAEDQPEQLAEVGMRLIEIDTHNINAHQFTANALVALERLQEAAEVIGLVDVLPFDIAALLLQGVDGGYVLGGEITNRTMDPGADATLRFRFYSPDGTEVGSQEVTMTLGDVEQPLGFEVEFPTDQEVLGYNYEVL